MNNYYKKYIERTFYLAKKGQGKVSPNPLVGCVIVNKDKIIGEGYHEKYGNDHAEINAIKSIQNNQLIKNSSVFINLEPCSYHGKTPPCVAELIKLQPKEIIISNMDPNPKVNGKGIIMLKNHGIKVICDVLKNKGEQLNKRFFTFVRKKRPYIILKWAETINGMMANEKNASKWISNKLSRQIVHKWRAYEDAILVGASTVEHDNPHLTVRSWRGKNPIRIVIDPKKRLSSKKKIFDNSAQTMNLIEMSKNNIKEIMGSLKKENIISVVVEGGASTLNNFIANKCWDEARIFQSNKIFNKGVEAPKINKKNLDYINVLDNKLFIKYNETD